MSAVWPTVLWLVRHGESTGNLARIAAEEAAASTITIAGRDVDVPLSELGQRQARALGAWFRAQPDTARPTVVLSSPYLRAQETARLIVAAAAFDKSCHVVSDERLREKEFGSLSRLTAAGIQATYPEEARRRAEIGKFYYRPPGGESWCDVILRLRSLLDYLQLRHASERVLLITHQVVVLCFRYLLEELDEAQLLSIDRDGDVANCSITTFRAARVGERSGLRLIDYNFVTPLENAGEPVTAAPDIAVKK
jgi:probable phosphoglycerate mutase